MAAKKQAAKKKTAAKITTPYAFTVRVGDEDRTFEPGDTVPADIAARVKWLAGE